MDKNMRLFRKKLGQNERLIKTWKNMPKKKKLNSKNPKYWDKSQLKEKLIKKKN